MLDQIPSPLDRETPTAYADRVGQWYSSVQAEDYRKRHGQFFTPIEVAKFMARMVESNQTSVKILDPGAGTGILTCAVCERLASLPQKPHQITIHAYEQDSMLIIALRRVLNFLQGHLEASGISTSIVVSNEDFVLKYGECLFPSTPMLPSSVPPVYFDLAISNPPYFKLPKTDPRAKAASAIVYGQPNIYAIFMAISASLLAPGGQLIFITPRSFASGLYFKRFRGYFFSKMRPKTIHLFDSRKESFRRDRILQENIIIEARKQDNWASHNLRQTVDISSSNGNDDLLSAKPTRTDLSVVLDMSSQHKVLKIPTTRSQVEIIDIFESWTGSLNAYGLEISTGPVVPFRALAFLSDQGCIQTTHAPLIWMQSVKPMKLTWPVRLLKKSQYIQVDRQTLPLLVSNKTYVLLRRMSAKEENRRLTAAVLPQDAIRSPLLGIENHLNYIHRPDGDLSREEAWGLAALYNSEFFDTYFRVLNGNTQVSATELRMIPLPDLSAIVEIGHRIAGSSGAERKIDRVVYSVLFEPALKGRAHGED